MQDWEELEYRMHLGRKAAAYLNRWHIRWIHLRVKLGLSAPSYEPDLIVGEALQAGERAIALLQEARALLGTAENLVAGFTPSDNAQCRAFLVEVDRALGREQ